VYPLSLVSLIHHILMLRTREMPFNCRDKSILNAHTPKSVVEPVVWGIFWLKSSSTPDLRRHDSTVPFQLDYSPLCPACGMSAGMSYHWLALHCVCASLYVCVGMCVMVLRPTEPLFLECMSELEGSFCLRHPHLIVNNALLNTWEDWCMISEGTYFLPPSLLLSLFPFLWLLAESMCLPYAWRIRHASKEEDGR